MVLLELLASLIISFYMIFIPPALIFSFSVPERYKGPLSSRWYFLLNQSLSLCFRSMFHLRTASLITSTTSHWKRTRVLAGQMWMRDLESLTYLPGAAGKAAPDRTRLFAGAQWKGQNAAQSLGEVATQSLNRHRYMQGMYPPKHKQHIYIRRSSLPFSTVGKCLILYKHHNPLTSVHCLLTAGKTQCLLMKFYSNATSSISEWQTMYDN